MAPNKLETALTSYSYEFANAVFNMLQLFLEKHTAYCDVRVHGGVRRRAAAAARCVLLIFMMRARERCSATYIFN